MDTTLTTDRLEISGWTPEDAEAAYGIFGAREVTHWLTPAMDQVGDVAAMASVLRGWQQAQAGLLTPQGRWAVRRRDNGEVVGGVSIQLLPPFEDDLEVSWQLRPDAWGHGYASEASAALVEWAFTQDTEELFAVARPNNVRAIATAKRLGMLWVGETTKYYDLRLQVFRVRHSDLITGDATS
ncbi:MAG TPA: GNAT family N-acetyltransferase [Pseudonocardiaceae bacterium]|jgi:RimJ/RimL family protein N-acetyltransferase|nr:GNAT family N-acetyltransferase [Pseudonocardiaceae bacterium]